MKLRTGYHRRPAATPPGFIVHEDAKNREREITAEMMARHIHKKEPSIFVMPWRRALCAKAIYARLPDAKYYGTDRDPTVAENVDELGNGAKIIAMKSWTVRDYIKWMAGNVVFDAAFLDYFCSIDLVQTEVKSFATKMLANHSVLAVTTQDNDAARSRNVIETLLREIGRVECLFFENYQTNRTMAHTIFLLEKGG